MDNESRKGSVLSAYISHKGMQRLDDLRQFAGGISKAEVIRRLLIIAGDPDIRLRVREMEV